MVLKIHPNKKRKWTKRKTRTVLFISFSLICLLAGTAAYGVIIYKKAETVLVESYKDEGRKKSVLRKEEVHPLKDSISILFIGVDES
ncbi:hypothetical protein MKZ02_22505 [Pseudobacillus sp. FSL P4-0506]|uniref:hypothetical protein n=1 Tax=Pseudobacillus sp. FSL P4-0506 TaxID=2921576 RepID=UPI0030F84E17